MDKAHGWNKLLGDPFFGEELGELSTEDARRLLTIIREEETSFSMEGGSLTIPYGKAEIVGFKAQKAMNGLKQLTMQAASDTETGWMHQFLTDQGWQARVFTLLDFLIKRLGSNLPDMEQLSPVTLSEMQAKRDSTNAQELEKEVARAEAARQSAEDARKAAEDAQEAAENAKETAEVAVKQVETAKSSANDAQAAADEARKAADSAKKTAEDAKRMADAEISRVKAARKSARAAASASKAAESASKDAKATADSIMPNMLTTLGVFIAIVIAVVACYLSVLLSQHSSGDQSTASPLSLAAILLMGHILLNIIFLLLYLISKLSAHTLACHCQVGDQMDCQQCARDLRGRCRLRHKLWLRYPYVIAMNGAFAAAYCALGLWHLLQHYFGASIDQVLGTNWKYAAVVVGATAALIIGAGIFTFRFFLHSPRQSLDAQQKRETARQEREAARQKKAEQAVQKKEAERKTIRKLRDEVAQQKDQIAQLQSAVEDLSKKLDALAHDKDRTPA